MVIDYQNIIDLNSLAISLPFPNLLIHTIFRSSTDNQFINLKISHIFQTIQKMQFQKQQKTHYGSQAPTQAEELTTLNISPVPTKPKDDPDAPPALELQDNGEFALEGSGFFEEDAFGEQKCKGKRTRTRSEDNQYSILGFLEKKIRVRIMSEELADKVSAFHINQ